MERGNLEWFAGGVNPIVNAPARKTRVYRSSEHKFETTPWSTLIFFSGASEGADTTRDVGVSERSTCGGEVFF